MKKLLSLLLTASLAAASAQEGLYAPAPPAGSAFVRVLNAPSATIGATTVTAPKSASPYVVIPQGTFDVKIGALGGKLKVEAGKFYSVFNDGGKLTLLTDQAAQNRAKALVTVYNLSKTPVADLKTADGKLTVVSGVKMGESGSRAVNGITVDLAAFAGTKELGKLTGVQLERGNAYALILTESGLTITQSTTKAK